MNQPNTNTTVEAGLEAAGEPGGKGVRSGHAIRWVLGSLLVLGSCAAAYVVFNAMSVEYAFQNYRAGDSRGTDPTTMAEANKFLPDLLRKDPTNGRVRNEYASLLGRQREYGRAIEEHKRAALIHNAQNGLHFIADMQHKMGNYEAAEMNMRDCLIINPTNPRFNNFHLWLLNARLIESLALQESRSNQFDRKAHDKLASEFGHAVRNWAIRAPHDVNSYAFLGNYYVRPLHALQAYRVMLIALSGNPYMTQLVSERYVPGSHMMRTIGQILSGDYAPRYKGLP